MHEPKKKKNQLKKKELEIIELLIFANTVIKDVSLRVLHTVQTKYRYKSFN
jgi:hypothetical protein